MTDINLVLGGLVTILGYIMGILVGSLSQQKKLTHLLEQNLTLKEHNRNLSRELRELANLKSTPEESEPIPPTVEDSPVKGGIVHRPSVEDDERRHHPKQAAEEQAMIETLTSLGIKPNEDN